MLALIKDFVRTRPRLFDRIRAMRRRLMRRGSDPTYDFLDDYSRHHDRPVNFLQIGANDGLRNDPIREFIIRDKWCGIFVEPLPTVFPLLKRNYEYAFNYDLTFVNAAVSAKDDQLVPFYSFEEEYLDQLSLEERLNHLRKASFQQEHVIRMVGNANASRIREIQVPTLTIASLLRRYWRGGPMDLLVIDAEGHESTILNAADLSCFHPEVIFLESHNLGDGKRSLFAMLESHGYSLCELGPDTAAVRDPRSWFRHGLSA